MKKNKIKMIEAEDGHFYSINDDELNETIYLPSSTNILSCFPNPSLDFWRETTSPEEIKRKQNEGKMSGSKVHHIIDLEIRGEKVGINGCTEEQVKMTGLTDRKLTSYLRQELTDREEKSLIGFENWWEDYEPITIGNELMVINPKEGYAGTLDWVGYLKDKKTGKYEVWIIDWKISKALSKSYDLQLVSYLKAFQQTYKKKAKVRVGILQLGINKCKYRFKEIKDLESDWDLFLKTKDIWNSLSKRTGPKVKTRRESFKLNKFIRKGKRIKL